MSLIKGLSTSLGGMMPEVAESMQDLSSMLGDIATGKQFLTKEQWRIHNI